MTDRTASTVWQKARGADKAVTLASVRALDDMLTSQSVALKIPSLFFEKPTMTSSYHRADDVAKVQLESQPPVFA